MRQVVLALLLVPGISAAAHAQGLFRVEITDGQFRSGMSAAATPYTAGVPWAAVPAIALPGGADPTVAAFRIRSWVEGEGVRVVVFAVARTDPRREVSEAQIASVFVPIGQSVEVTATEKYNARRFTLRAGTLPWRYTVQYHGLDLPVQTGPVPQRRR
jgi:hypothetical protein